MNLRRGDVERERDVLPRAVSCLLDGPHQELQRIGVLPEVGRKAPFVPDRGDQALLVEELLQRVEHLGAHAQRFREGGGPDRDDHEFLDVEVVVRVRPPVDDVHERDGKGLGARAAEVAVEGQGVRLGGRFRDRDRYAEHLKASQRVKRQARF